MAVFTPITQNELLPWLPKYNLGDLISFTEISQGTVNSTFLVITNKGKWVLSLMETLDLHATTRMMAFIAHLKNKGLPVPHWQKAPCDLGIVLFKDKPMVIVSFLEGHPPNPVTPGKCQQIGKLLVKLHAHGTDYTPTCPNLMSNTWLTQTLPKLKAHLTPADWQLALECWQIWQQFPWAALPKAMVHSDLFRDNVLFQEELLTGLIDFNFLCYESRLWDLCIAINDWAFEHSQFIPEHFKALIQSYVPQEPITPLEHTYFPQMLALTAFRFWISRLQSQHLIDGPSQGTIKNPDEFKHILQWHLNHPLQIDP